MRTGAKMHCERCGRPFTMKVTRHRVMLQVERSRGMFSSDGWCRYMCPECADAVRAKLDLEIRGGA